MHIRVIARRSSFAIPRGFTLYEGIIDTAALVNLPKICRILGQRYCGDTGVQVVDVEHNSVIYDYHKSKGWFVSTLKPYYVPADYNSITAAV